MHGRLARLRRAWAPASLLGAVALVGLVEWGLARRGRDLTTMWAAAWTEAARAATAEAPDADILFLGDSQVMQGVAPRVVAREAGRPAYNLAVFKGLAPASYFLLRRALDAGARPAAVCVDGELLSDDPRELTRLWPELLGPLEILDLARTLGDAEYGLELLIGKALPSVRMRHEIRAAALNAGGPRDRPANKHMIAHHLRHWRSNAGAHVRPADAVGAEDAESGLEASGYVPGWRPHPANAAYVERLLELADARGVPVFWLIPPVRAEVQARRDRGGLSAGYDAWLRDLQARHPRLVVLDGRRSGYPREALADLTHLNRTGTAAFSAAVGAALRDRLGGAASPAWVALAAYEPPSEPLLAEVEDFRETGRILRAAAESNRLRR
jgi:hypothetical protein